MKKLIFIPILMVLMGCQIYEQQTYPDLSGQWLLVSVDLSNAGSTPDGTYHILSDTVVFQQYEPVSMDDNWIYFSKNFYDPTLKWYDKFIINHTVWEFETNLVGIPTTIGGKRGYSSSSYYFPGRDMISGKWNSITIVEGGRHMGIDQYGMEEMVFTLPRVWTMFKRNTNIEFFFQETVVLRFRRI